MTPCWADVRESIVHFPWQFWGWIIVPPLLAGFLLWAPGISRLWLRNTIRFVGGMLAACYAVMGLPMLIFGSMLATGDPAPQYQTLTSPKGTYEARLMYQGGFLGRDFSAATIKTKDCCRRQTVFEYAGPSYMKTMHMRWLDDTHLQITYSADADRYQTCREHLGALLIECVRVSWPAH